MSAAAISGKRVTGHPLTIDESVIYREEVLAVMGVVGEIRAELQTIRRLIQADDSEEETEADD